MPTISGAGLPGGSPHERLVTARIARMATVRSDDSPHLVPVTFAIAGETLVTAIDSKPKRTNNLQRLRNLRANPAVSIVVDEYDEDWSTLWWVRVDGTAEIVEDEPGRTAPVAALVAKYPQYQHNVPQGPVIVVHPARWTAWSAVTADGGA